MEDARHYKEGKLVVFKRNGIFQARIAVAPNRYKYKSLKTREEKCAFEAAQKVFYVTQHQIEAGESVFTHSVSKVISEYVAIRERQFARGETSKHMLRQVKRSLKFWCAYVGNRGIDAIGNTELRAFIDWRKEYYVNNPTKRPNVKLHPTEQEIQQNVTMMRAVLRWSQDMGYRGNKQLPNFAFTPSKIRVRPAFELGEYGELWKATWKWARDCEDLRLVHTRWLLHHYVLFLANSGVRIGEANNLRIRDVVPMTDTKDRKNYRLIVNRGKTGQRDAIVRASSAAHIDRWLEIRKGALSTDFLFVMADGKQVTTLADQFNKVIKAAGLERSGDGRKYTLYSLRHFYAVQALRRENMDIFAVARNMGTSVEMIQKYYGKQATPALMAARLGD